MDNNTNAPGFPPVDDQHHDADFGLIDFMNEANFEQFIELIRGENADPIVNFCPKFDCEHISGCFGENQFLMPIQENLFHHDHLYVADHVDPSLALEDALPGDMKLVTAEEEKEAEENDGEESSATTTTTKRSTKGDRSRTLVSERRRRGRMKEKLYALRALVPNITKMDKASIIGDAVLYVQDLQMQAKKLKAEIAALESSLSQPNISHHRSFQNANNINFTHNQYPITKKILKIDVIPVEEMEFYVRLVCIKGLGVAASLYKAIESFSSFNVQSTNLATAAEEYLLTFTLKAREFKMDMELPNLKLWIATAFLNQGFDFETSL